MGTEVTVSETNTPRLNFSITIHSSRSIRANSWRCVTVRSVESSEGPVSCEAPYLGGEIFLSPLSSLEEMGKPHILTDHGWRAKTLLQDHSQVIKCNMCYHGPCYKWSWEVEC